MQRPVGGTQAVGGGAGLVPVRIDQRGGTDFVEPVDLLAGELDVDRAEVVEQLLILARADHQRGHPRLREQVGQRLSRWALHLAENRDRHCRDAADPGADDHIWRPPPACCSCAPGTSSPMARRSVTSSACPRKPPGKSSRPQSTTSGRTTRWCDPSSAPHHPPPREQRHPMTSTPGKGPSRSPTEGPQARGELGTIAATEHRSFSCAEKSTLCSVDFWAVLSPPATVPLRIYAVKIEGDDVMVEME